MLDSEDITASHWTDGGWNIVLPFEVNGADVIAKQAVNDKLDELLKECEAPME